MNRTYLILILLIIIFYNCASTKKKADYNQGNYQSPVKTYRKHGIFFRYPSKLTVQEARKNSQKDSKIYFRFIGVSSPHALIQFNILNVESDIKKQSILFFDSIVQKSAKGNIKLVKSSEKKKTPLLTLRHANIGKIQVPYFRKQGYFLGTLSGQQSVLDVISFVYNKRTYTIMIYMKKSKTFVQQVMKSFIILK